MTIHKKSVQLAGLYLTILMAISLFFSGMIYQLSLQELDRGLRRPGPGSVINRLPVTSPGNLTLNDLLQERELQYQEARNRIINRLIMTNLFILIVGGALSYYLAVRTLRPIEEAHEAQSRFTADASHELRTPIAAMQTETEVALMDPKLTLAKAKSILRSNIEELAKLTQLSEGLLRLSQAENQHLVAENISLNRVVQKSIDRLSPLASNKKIVINLKAPNEVMVKADEASIEEAVVIILDNAIKYSPEKSQISVELHNDSRAGIVKISDTGIGIKATELPHIFERFYRADSSRSKQKISGYGIGLAIAKNIIDMNKGKINVSSAVAKGTTFRVILPRH